MPETLDIAITYLNGSPGALLLVSLLISTILSFALGLFEGRLFDRQTATLFMFAATIGTLRSCNGIYFICDGEFASGNVVYYRDLWKMAGVLLLFPVQLLILKKTAVPISLITSLLLICFYSTQMEWVLGYVFSVPKFTRELPSLLG